MIFFLVELLNSVMVEHTVPTSPASCFSASRSSGPVRAVLFTEFQDVEGYVVSASNPTGVMQDQFKDIGYHFLPDKGICWRLISMLLGDYRIMGVPVHIEHSKYTRRAYVFCMCLIVDNLPQSARLGKIAAQELAQVFHGLECDYSFLSNKSNLDPINHILKNLRCSLNSNDKPFIDLGILGASRLQFLKPSGEDLKRALTEPRANIKPFYVALSLIDPKEFCDAVSENYRIVEILSACNGDWSVSEISNKLQVDFSELCSLLSHLEMRNLLVLIDQPVDQFTRVRITSEFHSFFDDLTNRQDAVEYSRLSATSSFRSSETSSGTGTPKAVYSTDQQPTSSSSTSFSNLGDYLVRLYCKLDGHTQDLGEFASVNNGMNISIRQMVMFGILKKFLRCKTMFPVYPDYERSDIPLLRSCDGRYTWDEIGILHALTRSELDKMFSHHNVVRIWK